jgi:DNA 3'-phosphatase
MWKEVESVIYYIPHDFKFQQSLAIFNFIGTLISQKHRKKITDITKLKYSFKTIKAKLKEITEKGASIAMYQCFTEFQFQGVKELFELVLEDLEIPIVAFFVISPNGYVKPFTHMWKLMEIFYKQKEAFINKETSILVGHHAGRINVSTRKPIDVSCKDRAFAKNVGITFFTPERFFLNDTSLVLWKYDDYVINQPLRKYLLESNKRTYIPVIIDEIYAMPKSDIYTVIITGPPSCGKTTFVNKIKRKWCIEYKIGTLDHISENTFEEFDEINNSLKQSLENKHSAIIDITCRHYNLTQLVKTSMICEVPILIIEIMVKREVACLLNFIYTQKNKPDTYKLVTKYQWRIYNKAYKEPCFSEIPCVRYVRFPILIQLCDEYWYEYSY